MNTPEHLADAADDSGPIGQLAERLHLTEGQLYTYVIGTAFAIAVAIGGIPPALRHRPLPPQALAPTTSLPAGQIGLTPPTPVPAPAPGPGNILGPAPGPAGGSQLAPNPSPVSTPVPSDPTPDQLPVPPAGTISVFTRVGPPGAPSGVTVGADGTIYVTTDNGTVRGVARTPSKVLSYDSQGGPLGALSISGQPVDHTDGLTGAVLDPRTGHLLVLDAGTARIIAIDPAAGTQRVFARVPDLPSCLLAPTSTACEPGPQDHVPAPHAAAFDAQGALYVTDPSQATIWRMRAGDSAPQIWHQSIDYATGDGPAGLAFDAGGRLDFTVGTSLDVNNPGAGGLYRLTINLDGSPGVRTLRAAYARDDRPGALAIGASGISYLVLRGPGSLLAVRPDGTLATRFTSPPGADIPLDGPAGLTVTTGRLLVANQSTRNSARHWAVLSVAVDDTAISPR